MKSRFNRLIASIFCIVLIAGMIGCPSKAHLRPVPDYDNMTDPHGGGQSGDEPEDMEDPDDEGERGD